MSNLVLRSGCASNSSVGVIVNQAAPTVNKKLGELAPSSVLSYLDALPGAPAPVALDLALQLAGEQFDAAGTEDTNAQGVVVLSLAPIVIPNMARVVAAAAALQQRGVRIIAVTWKVADDVAFPDSTDATFATLRQSLHAVVSFPPDRHIIHVFRYATDGARGDVGAFPDLAFPGWTAFKATTDLTTPITPMDPRSGDACSVPHTCIVSAAGRVRTLTGESYDVRRGGDYVLASFRSPVAAQVDVFGGFGPCGNHSGWCLQSFKVVSRSRFISINAAPNHRGTRLVVSGQWDVDMVGGNDFAVDGDAGHVPTDNDGITYQYIAPIAGTWTSTYTGEKRSAEARGAYSIQVAGEYGLQTTIAHIQVDFELDSPYLSVSMTLSAESSPVRSGLCGVPAGSVGDAAMSGVGVNVDDLAMGKPGDLGREDDPFAAQADSYKPTLVDRASGRLPDDVAVSAASAVRPCPAVSEPYRPMGMDTEALRRLHVMCVMSEDDWAHIYRLESDATRKDRVHSAQRLSHHYITASETFVRDVPSDEKCVRAFGPRSKVTDLCNSNAAVGVTSPVFPLLRALVSLCRMRCLNPDTALRSRKAKVLRGGASQADFQDGGAGTEILSDLVAVSWCDTNVCTPSEPLLKKTLPTAPAEVDWTSSYTPHWLHLSPRKTAQHRKLTLDNLNIFVQDKAERALVAPPVAGNYLLRAKAAPQGCNAMSTNVSLNVRCPLQLEEPYAGPDVNVTSLEAGFPFVSLFGQVNVVPGLAAPPKVQIFWGVAQAPPNGIPEYEGAWDGAINLDTLFWYPSTTTPMFLPAWPGDWVLHMSVFDGCQVRSRNVTVKARCGRGCGGGSVSFTAVPSIMLHKNPVVMPTITATFAADPSQMMVGGRLFNVTTPAATFKQVTPPSNVVTETKIAGKVDTLHAGAATVPWLKDATIDRFTYFATKIWDEGEADAAPAPVVADATLGYYVTDKTDTQFAGSETSSVQQRFSLPTPTQCSLQFATPAPALGVAFAQTPTISYPQTKDEVIGKAWYETTVPSGVKFDRLDPLHYPTCVSPWQVRRSTAVASSGVTVAWYDNSPVSLGVFVSTTRHDKDCGAKDVRSANVSVFALPLATTYTVEIAFDTIVSPAPAAAAAVGADGRPPSEAWLEYRKVDVAAVPTTGKMEWDPVGGDGSVWNVAVGGYTAIPDDTAAKGWLVANIPGPAVVRVRFRFAPEVDMSWLISSSTFDSFASPNFVTPTNEAKVCRDQAVPLRVQATDGCKVYTDVTETSFKCPIPPHIQLITPHYALEYDYKTSSFPSFFIEANSYAQANLHLNILSNASRQLTAADYAALTALTADYTYDITAYHTVPGYAHGELASGSAQVDITLPTGAVSASTACPAPGGAGLLGGGWSAPDWSIVQSQPRIDVPEMTDSLYFNVGCGVAKGNQSLYYSQDDIFSDNVTHANLTFRLLAVGGEVIAADKVVFEVSYASVWYPGVGAFDTVDKMPESMFTSLLNVTTPLQNKTGFDWSYYSFVIPLLTGYTTRKFVFRLSVVERSAPQVNTNAAGVFGISRVSVRPVYMDTQVWAQVPTPQELFKIQSGGVARFAVSARTQCDTSVSFIDVQAKCKHEIPTQSWQLYAANGTTGNNYMVASGSGATTGLGKVIGHPTAGQFLIWVVDNGTVVVDGTGKVSSRIVVGDKPRLGVPSDMWTAYGGVGATHPATNMALPPADLLSGVFATTTSGLIVYQPGPAKVEMRFTDGCASRTESVDFVFECSQTVFKAPATYILNGISAVDRLTLAVDQAYDLFFAPDAWFTDIGANTGSETNISLENEAGVRVELVAYPTMPAGTTTFTKAVEFDGMLARGIVQKANATDGQILKMVDFERRKIPLRFNRPGEYRFRVTHHFWAFDCAASAPYEVVLNVIKRCADGDKTSIAYTPQFPEPFQLNMSWTIPGYPTGDFTSAADKGSAKLQAMVNGIISQANTRIHSLELDSTGANPVLNFVLLQNSTEVELPDLLDKAVFNNVQFQRYIGVITAHTLSAAMDAPYTATLTWAGPLADRLDVAAVYGITTSGIVPICGAGAMAPCPTYSSMESRTIDIKVESTWATRQVSFTNTNSMSLRFDFTNAFPTCNSVTYKYRPYCRYRESLPIAPVGAIGVRATGASPISVSEATMSPSTPGTVIYGATEPRSFPRVYLWDSINKPWHEIEYGGTGARETYDYEWWVKSAPTGSLYEPKNGSVTAVLKPNTTAVDTVEWVTMSYAIATDDSAKISEYWTKAGQAVTTRYTRTTVNSDTTASASWQYVKLPATCLSDNAPQRYIPSGEGCFSPDIAGEYELVYRAKDDCSPAAGFVNATLKVIAQCPLFTASLGALPVTISAYQGSRSTAVDELNVNVNLAGSILASYAQVRYSWKYARPGATAAEVVACEADVAVHDDRDTNATLRFPCAGVYNVSIFATDGCSQRRFYHAVEVVCDGGEMLKRFLPNSTVNFDVPEGGSLALYGTFEVAPGSDDALRSVVEGGAGAACARGLGWEWTLEEMTPANDYVISKEFAYEPKDYADASVRVVGLAADIRTAGRTTDGDVLTTIMVFAIGLSILAIIAIAVFLVISQREANVIASGLGTPSEPLPSKPLPE